MTSASIFVPSDGLLRFSVRILLLEPLEDRATIVSLKPSSNNPSLDDTRAVLQFSRSEHHGAHSFLITKYGMVSASNFSSVSRLVYSVGTKHTPQVQ